MSAPKTDRVGLRIRSRRSPSTTIREEVLSAASEAARLRSEREQMRTLECEAREAIAAGENAREVSAWLRAMKEGI